MLRPILTHGERGRRIMIMKVKCRIGVLILAVAALIACNDPGGSTSGKPPASGTLRLQAAVEFVSYSYPNTVYLYADFYVDGTLAAHLESAASGMGGSDLKEYQVTLPVGTHSVDPMEPTGRRVAEEPPSSRQPLASQSPATKQACTSSCWRAEARQAFIHQSEAGRGVALQNVVSSNLSARTTVGEP